MRTIIALGGGEIGRPGYPVETTAIDQQIIARTGKERPRLLFLPTASSDAETYCETVTKHFGKRLGCQMDVLALIRNKPEQEEIAEKILTADAIYVGGGNTLMMMKLWRRTGVDELLKQAYTKGTVLSGMSAGSICWFRWGNSDSRRFTNPSADLIRVSGLGFIPALHCPHYDTEKDRKADLKNMMQKMPDVAIAIDNCCALEVVDDHYRVIDSRSTANAYKVYWKAGIYHEEMIEKDSVFRSLAELVKK